MYEGLRFDERGLVPCVAQDFFSGEVLTLAYMNEESLRLTVETGEIHFYSRSREEIWKKGEASGSVMGVRELRYDCDGDAIVALVEPAAGWERWQRPSVMVLAPADGVCRAAPATLPVEGASYTAAGTVLSGAQSVNASTSRLR